MVWDMPADESYFDENDRANSQLVVKFPGSINSARLYNHAEYSSADHWET